MTHTGKVMPNLDQNTTKLLNLTVLQRMDPYIDEILITAAHVTFYEFNVELNQWDTRCLRKSFSKANSGFKQKTAMNVGHSASSPDNSGQPYRTSSTAPLSARVSLSPLPSLQIPSRPLPIPSIAAMPLHDTPDQVNSSNLVTNLIKPSSFFTPSSSPSSLMPLLSPMRPPLSPSMPNPISLHPPHSVQRDHGAPMLQPFPPPTPPPSLTPNSTAVPNYESVSKDKVRDALLLLVQDNQFIDMFHQALLKVHQS